MHVHSLVHFVYRKNLLVTSFLIFRGLHFTKRSNLCP